MNRTESSISSDDFERLVALATQLLPSDGILPGAVDLPDFGYWLNVALETREDLVAEIRLALAYTTSFDAHGVLSSLSAMHPTEFAALTTVIGGAYLMHPGVRSALGYPGQVQHHLRSDVDEYASMLAAVLDRGDRYRAVPS